VTEKTARMSFFEHLEDLRSRLLRAVLAVVAGFIVCVFFSHDLYEFISSPLMKLLPEGSSLVFIDPTEAFFMYLKVSFLGAVLLSIPYVLYQLWKFIAPGLYQKERRLAIPFVVVSTLLFYIGACFAYFLVFPVVFKFFLSFQTDTLQPMLSIKAYVSLVTKLMLAFGVIFETPIIIVFLGLLGIVNTSMLRKGRRYFIVIAFVIGAFLSPPDVASQIMMGLPLLVLYEASIHVLSIIEKRRKKREEEEDDGLDLDPVAELDSDSPGSEEEK
jgi:sec-independent protein translocase protein TatC